MAAKILVMDDDQCMRELMRLHLRNAGYEVLVAEDAVAAGHMVMKQRPDLILADVEMPFMTGLEFVEALRADHAVATIPVIFVTSRADAEARGKELGAVGFLTKPLIADRLLTLIAKHVEGGRQVIN